VTLQSALPVDGDLTLRPREPSDAAEVYAIVENHRLDLRRWLTWVDATHSATDMRRYAQYAYAQFERHSAFDYSIRENGKIVGAIGLHSLEWDNRCAQMGYWLSPDARGRGIVTRAAAALTSYGFGRLDLHRIEIRCVVENAASRGVAERLGYTFEGILHEAYYLHGRFRDIALYATTAPREGPGRLPKIR
jgi:ribosomal-protein-serine acetyltransferase